MEVLKILNPSNKIIQKNTDSGLQLCKIDVNEEYRKKWNIHQNDFVCLTKNGELISNNLYRIGGMNNPNLEKDNYFMLIKHVEAIYDFDFIKKCYPNNSKKQLELQRKHLEDRWVIIDKNGVEKVECQKLKHPYLVKDSCIYSIESKYHNIETGYFYCESSKSMESKEFIFLENIYNFREKDESKIGIMKINKKDGSYEVFKI